jgi:hypothetical protein
MDTSTVFEFEREDRAQLLEQPGHTSETMPAYRDYLVGLIASRTQEAAVELPLEPSSPWSDIQRVPEAVWLQAESLGAPTPSVAQWAALTPLQRFALLKLTRAGHDNENFLPALREFARTGTAAAAPGRRASAAP